MTWHGLRTACWQPLSGGGTAFGLDQPKVAKKVKLGDDDSLQHGGVCRTVLLNKVAGYIRYLMPIARCPVQ